MSTAESNEYVYCIFNRVVDPDAVSDAVMISEKIKRSNDALATMEDIGGSKLGSGPKTLSADEGIAKLPDSLSLSLSRNRASLPASKALDMNQSGSSQTFGVGEALLKRGVFLNELGALEQLVVRQLASLKLQSMMEKLLPEDEIVDMTDSGKQGVWGKFLGAFKPGKKIVKGLVYFI
jgi:hypothetical protein